MNIASRLSTAGLILLGLGVASLPGPADGGLTWSREGDVFRLTVAVESVHLANFLDFAVEALELPLQYSPQLVADRRVLVKGDVLIAVGETRAFVETILDQQGFLLVEAGYGSHAVLQLELVGPRRSPSAPPPLGWARPVDLGELAALRGRRTLVTVNVPVRATQARALVEVVEPMVDRHVGQARLVESPDLLVITERADTVARIVDVLGGIDVAASEPTSLHEQRLRDLDRRLAAVEARVAGW